MEKQNKSSVYLGIDINDRYAMVSFYESNMSEPETVGTVAGSEVFQIPLILAKRKELGQWYYGDEAKKKAKNQDMIVVDSLLQRAVLGDKIVIDDEKYDAVELLALYLKKIMSLPFKLGKIVKYDKVVITVDRLTKENMDMFWKISPRLGLSNNQFMVIDHKESFYYFALSQDSSLWIHDVFLLEYEKNAINSLWLNRNVRTTPQVIKIEEIQKLILGENKDDDFLYYLQKLFENKIVSTLYLVGNGFNGEWMKSSLAYMCRGRRVFMGMNLFSKGACYAAVARDNEENWKFIYMGENEMKFNLSLKVKDKGHPAFINLISAGKNWFEISGECDVILSGTTEIDFWKQLPNSREAVIESLELTDIPDRPDRTTRINIFAKPIADNKIEITIKDLGFGEFCIGSNKTWHYTMSI